MAQTVPFDALLGASKTGLAIGATIYQLDGSTSYAAFSTTGWYEAPAGSGGWHHPGLSLPDAGGVVAVGIAATEYLRIAVDAAPAAAPTAVEIRTELDSNSTKLANLDAAVSSRSTLTAAQVWDALTSALTTVGSIGKLIVDNLNATITSRMATFAYTAPDNASIANIKAKTDLIPDAPAATGDIPSAANIADAVWDEATADHVTAGTFGEQAKTDIDTLVTNVAAILLDTGTDGVVLSTAQMQALADIVLARGSAGIDDTADTDSIYELLSMILRGTTASGSWIGKKTDGVTTFNTRTLDTNPNAVPIVGVA